MTSREGVSLVRENGCLMLLLVVVVLLVLEVCFSRRRSPHLYTPGSLALHSQQDSGRELQLVIDIESRVYHCCRASHQG